MPRTTKRPSPPYPQTLWKLPRWLPPKNVEDKPRWCLTQHITEHSIQHSPLHYFSAPFSPLFSHLPYPPQRPHRMIHIAVSLFFLPPAKKSLQKYFLLSMACGSGGVFRKVSLISWIIFLLSHIVYTLSWLHHDNFCKSSATSGFLPLTSFHCCS